MTDIIDNAGGHRQNRYHDEGDGTFPEAESSHLRAWDTTLGSWVRVIVDHASGALQTTSAAGGGGAATIADGADVAQGTTTDVAWVSGNGTVISLLKKIASAGGSAVSVADGADVAQGTTTDVAWTSGAGTVIGILKAIKAAISGTLTVATHAVTQSGTWTTGRTWSLLNTTDSVNVGNFPATQPVSLATAPTTPVTGTFFQATQPVSAASLPLPTGASTAANQSTVKAASIVAAAADTASVVQHSPQRADAANLCVTNTAATGVACTLTIPSAGAGLFHYISLIEIQLYATTARTGGATPVLVTTTNLPGSPVWDFDTAQAIGVTIRQATQPATPIKSSAAATATTIVAPIATTGIWRITAYYYAAP